MIKKITSKIATKIENNAEKIVQKGMREVKNDLVRSPIVERLESRESGVKMIDIDRGLFIDELRNKLDVEGLEKYIDMDNRWERIKYMSAIGEKARKATGVDFTCENTKECTETLKQASEILTGQLILYKKLKMTLPDTIHIADLGYDGVKKTIVAKLGDFSNGLDDSKPSTIMFLDKNMFKEEYKGEFKSAADFVLYNFNHELTHSRHIKENTEIYRQLKSKGLNAILTKNEENTMYELKYKFYKHYRELNKNGFFNNAASLETNLAHDDDNPYHRLGTYNMGSIGNQIKMLEIWINYDRKNPEDARTLSIELLKDFSPEFLKKLEPIHKKFESITDTICEENLRSYAFCNPLETVAVAAEKEFRGEALSDDMRKLLKKFGYPETKHMSYLPYNHPVMVKMRETQKTTSS